MAKKRVRPKMKTKEELIAYLEQNPETELPFNPIVWEKAVEATEGKERQFKELTTVEFDGTVKSKRIPNGAVNPVGKYFQMIALPQYNTPYIDDFDIDDEDDYDDSEDVDDDGTETDNAVDSLMSLFFSDYTQSDKKIIKERLSDYYDNYELNDGADKLLVIKAVADELELANLTKQRLKRGADVEARLEKVQKGYLSLLESLKALKKQRSAMDDEGKNKLTLWVDELEKNGEFTYSFDDVSDDIDRMLIAFEDSMMKVYREG